MKIELFYEKIKLNFSYIYEIKNIIIMQTKTKWMLLQQIGQLSSLGYLGHGSHQAFHV